jgi:predicted amidohydrolase
MKPLVTAAVQAQPVPGEIAVNALAAARLVRAAAARGAELVVLPELFLPAYHPLSLADDPVGTSVKADEAGRVDDPRLDPLRETGVVTVIGAAVSYPDGRRTCSALVADRAGVVHSAYDKQHLWGPEEKALFTPGTRGSTLSIDGWRLGLGVCYDGCFPEHGRAAAGDGVHGYLAPSGYVQGSEHRRDLYYAARALDNTMYVVFANSSGDGFNGGAAIYDPEGRCLGRGKDDGEEIIVATLDPAQLERTRAAHTMLKDRLPYQGLTRHHLPA